MAGRGGGRRGGIPRAAAAGGIVAAAVVWFLLAVGIPGRVSAPPPAPGPASPRAAAAAPLPAPPVVPGDRFPAAEPDRLRILGQVVDPSGRPVAGAEVEARRWSGGDPEGSPGRVIAGLAGGDLLARTEAGEEGLFRLLLEGGEPCALAARAPGFAPGILEPVRPAPEGGAAPVRLVLRPGLALTVRVVDGEGRPVPGAAVAVFAVRGHSLLDPCLARGTTGPEGEAALGPLPAGSLALSALRADGAAAVRMIWFARPGTVEILLGGGASLVVVVTDGEGVVVEGARVAALLDGPGGGVVAAATGADGRASWAGLPPATLLQVTAEAPGFAATQSAAAPGGRLSPFEPLEVPVVLGRGAVVRGRVREAGGAGIPGVAVRLHATRRFPLDGALEAVTDGAGAFRFEGVPRGEALLAAPDGESPGGCLEAGLVVPDGEGAEVVQDLRRGEAGTVRGRVVDGAGNGVGGAVVGILPATVPAGRAPAPGVPRRAGGTATTGGDGAFVATGVPAGEGLVARATAAGLLAGASPPFRLEPGGVVEGIGIRLTAGATLLGRVESAAGGVVAGAVLTAVPAGDGGEGGSPEWTTVADAAGEFRLAALRPGPFTLHAEAAGYRRCSQPGLAAVEGVETRVDIRLQSGPDLAGRVEDGAGRPVAGARVTALPAGGPAGGGSAAAGGVATTDASGSFRIGGLPPGPCRVEAEAPGFAALTREGASAGDGDLLLVLRPGRMIRGLVRDGEGRPIPGVWVSARPRPDGGRARSVRTAGDGAFLLDGLGEGPFTLEFHGEPAHAPRTLEGVAAGGDALLVSLEATNLISGRVLDPAGRGLEGRYLLRVHREDGEVVPVTLTRWSGGRFRISGLPSGEFLLRVRALEGGDLAGEERAATGRTGVEIRLSGR